MEGWDDLRILWAVAQAGTVTAGARALGVDQTTVSRRLRALEKRAGHALFERLRGGVVLTPSGEAYARAAHDLQDRVQALERETAGEIGLVGTLRLTLPKLLARAWMSPLVRFAAAHPALSLEIISSDQRLDLARREVDLAIRDVERPPDGLVGQKLGRLGVAVFAHRRLDQVPLTELPWVGWDPGRGSVDRNRRERERLGITGPVPITVSDSLALLEAMRLGAGAALLPCLTGDAVPGLSRRTSPTISQRYLWALAPEELAKSAKVRSMMAELARLAEVQRDALIGVVS